MKHASITLATCAALLGGLAAGTAAAQVQGRVDMNEARAQYTQDVAWCRDNHTEPDAVKNCIKGAGAALDMKKWQAKGRDHSPRATDTPRDRDWADARATPCEELAVDAQELCRQMTK